MPKRPQLKDPFILFEESRRAKEQEQKQFDSQAARVLAEKFPDFVRSAPPDVFEAKLREVSGLLRQQADPVQLTPDLPTLGNRDVLSSFDIPRRALNSAIGVIPDEMRPQNVFEATGTSAIGDLASGNTPKIDDVGMLAQTVGPALAAAIPQTKTARALTSGVKAIGPATQSVIAATGVAGFLGSAQEVTERAQELMEMADREVPSFREALSGAARDVSPEAMVVRGIGEGMFELATAGASFAFPLGVKTIFGKFSGVTEETAMRMMRYAEKFNIELSLQDVTTSRLVERTKDVLGRFPGPNTIFVREAERTREQFGRGLRRSMGDVAPSLTAAIEATAGNPRSQRILEANVRAFNRLEGAFSTFKGEANSRYAKFLTRAEATNTTVGHANTLATAIARKDRILKNTREKVLVDTGLVDAAGKAVKKEGLKEYTPKGSAARAVKLLQSVIDMEDMPSVARFRGKSAEIEEMISTLPQGSPIAKDLIEVKKAMERDFMTNLEGPQDVLTLKKSADEFYKEGINVFAGNAGQRVRRVDRSFGRVTLDDIEPGQNIPHPGTSSPDVILDLMFKTDDPGVIRNLYEILTRGGSEEGKQIFREAAALNINSKLARAVKTEAGTGTPVPYVDRIRSNFGIDDPTSPKFRANQMMFKLAGGSKIEELSQVLDLAERVFKDGVPDVSSMITRRALLGGFSSGLRTFTPTVAKGSGAEPVEFLKNIANAATFYLVSRGVSKTIATPGALRAYRVLLDPRKTAPERMNAVKRLLVLDSTFMVFDELTGGNARKLQSSSGALAADLLRETRGAAGPLQPGDSVTTPLPAQGGSVR